MDVQAKEQAEAVRCLSLERESRTFEELVHLRGTYRNLKPLPSYFPRLQHSADYLCTFAVN